jgi:hypothetical protein
MWSAVFAIGLLASQVHGLSKKGIAYIPYGYGDDYNLLLSSRSPLDWYYTWYPDPAPADTFYGNKSSSIEFVPTLKSLQNITDAVLHSLPNVTTSKYLFTFNEPDGTVESGGSDLSPQDAARVYIDKIVPLRSRFQLSHPAVTGSERGMKWLKDFNAACWSIDPKNGCPLDFVVVHWYGDFLGMTSWIGQLASWYNGTENVGLQGQLRMWVTEIGLPQGSNESNWAVLNQTMPYLDQLPYVERYAWFGIFRPSNANTWTGSGLSLFHNDGGLSDLGALYVDGQANGFTVGDKGISYATYNASIANTTGNATGSHSNGAAGNSLGLTWSVASPALCIGTVLMGMIWIL